MVGKRALRLDQPVELPPERLRPGAGKAGADPAHVAQALALVHAEQEGPETNSRPLGLREAADDELLLAQALRLEPGAITP
jgi:hypothetical protein